MPAKCAADQVLNAASGRCVKRAGRVGGRLLRAAAPAKPLVIVIVGLGCSTARMPAVASGLRHRWPGAEVEVLCHASTGKILKNVVKTYCSIIPSKRTPFVQGVVERVLAALPRRRVILAGHSYGGSVVARVAEVLSARRPASLANFGALTFGSIYVPPAPRTAGVGIVHYMHYGDVALRCNGLAPGQGGSHVAWQGQPSGRGRARYAILGTLAEWRVHNGYWSTMQNVVSARLLMSTMRGLAR